MDRVTLYLRASLYSPPGPDAHVPPGAVVVTGKTSEGGGSGGVTLTIESLLDERGRALPAKPVTVVIPWSKIDHVLLLEG